MPNALRGGVRREKPRREHLATTATLFRLAQRIRASKGSKGLPRKINPVPDCSSGMRLGHSRHCELISCLNHHGCDGSLTLGSIKAAHNRHSFRCDDYARLNERVFSFLKNPLYLAYHTFLLNACENAGFWGFGRVFVTYLPGFAGCCATSNSVCDQGFWLFFLFCQHAG